MKDILNSTYYILYGNVFCAVKSGISGIYPQTDLQLLTLPLAAVICSLSVQRYRRCLLCGAPGQLISDYSLRDGRAAPPRTLLGCRSASDLCADPSALGVAISITRNQYALLFAFASLPRTLVASSLRS